MYLIKHFDVKGPILLNIKDNNIIITILNYYNTDIFN